MAFLGISLKSAKMGTGRALLSHMEEKRQDKLREEERQNRIDDLTTELKLRDDYAIKSEERAYDREIDRLRETNTIKNENDEQDWRLGLQRQVQLSTQTGKNYAYLGNGNYKILEDDDDPMALFNRQVQEAQTMTEALRKSGQIGAEQMVLPKGFTVTGESDGDKESYYNDEGIIGVGGKKIRAFRSAFSPAKTDPSYESITFEYGEGQLGKVVFADESRLQKEKVPYHNASLLMGTLLETGVDTHISRYRANKAGQPQAGADLFGYTRQFFLNNAPSILEGLKGAKTTEGVTAIPNPMIRFNLTEYAKQGTQQAEHAKFIATEIIAPALTLQKELALQALNLPAETPTYTDDNGTLYIESEAGARLQPYSHTVMVNGNPQKQLLPEFKTLATDVARHSGRSLSDVLSHAVQASSDPMDHLKKLQAITPQVQAKVKKAGLEKVDVKNDVFLKTALTDVVRDSKDGTTAISAIRSMIPSAPPREITEIMATPSGSKKPIWNRTVKDFSGIDIEGARQRSESSAKARKTIAMIRDLQDKYGARTDPIALLEIKLAGGVEALGAVSGLLDDFETYLNEADIAGTGDELERNTEARRQTLSELRQIRNTIATGGRLEASALALMLSKQLGYYMAGAVQGGGSTGRNISDFDVRQNMNALQLDTFAPTSIKKANLEYLYEEMDQTYAIYSSYASSGGDFATWQATQMYDDLVQGTHSDLTRLLARAGAIPADEAERRSLRLQETGGVIIREQNRELDPFGQSVQGNQ